MTRLRRPRRKPRLNPKLLPIPDLAAFFLLCFQVQVKECKSVSLHLPIELVSSGIKITSILLLGTSTLEGVSYHVVRSLHFRFGVEWILIAIQHHGRCRRPHSKNLREIQVAWEQRQIGHPSVGKTFIQQKLTPRGHETYGDGTANAVIQSSQKDSAHASARQTRTAYP